MDSIAAAEAWSVKEAVYKAINRDEPFRPRQFESFRRPTGEWGCRVNGCSLEGLVSIVTTSCGNDQMTLVNATGRLGVSVNHTSQESTKEIEYAIS